MVAAFLRPRVVCPALAALVVVAAAPAQEPIRLQEDLRVGYQYHVSTRTELSGVLNLPPEKGQAAPKPLAVEGRSMVEYDERILAASAGRDVQKTVRVYSKMEFYRKVGDKPQDSSLRQAVRRLVLLRHQNAEVPFSPDGPLLWSEIDLVRTDVFTPALAGLLPDQPVRPGDRWTASPAAVQELTDLEKIDDGRLECRLETITTLQQRRYAHVALSGTVRGINEDGPNRQQLDGHYLFDLQSNHLSYVSLRGVSSLLDKDGAPQGSISGVFVLTRKPQESAELADASLRGVAVEPNADNTLLLYDNLELGLRFLYPRRWRVAGVQGRQVALDEPGGSGLLLTVEPPAAVPTAAQYLTESRDWLGKQKIKLLRIDPPRRLQYAPQELEQFGLEVEEPGRRVLLHYYVARQSLGGATLAARLLPTDLAAVQREAERIARSVAITRSLPAGTPKGQPAGSK